jgi:hypothetical protein
MKKHICDICGKEFDSSQKLGGHKSAHKRTENAREQRECLFCNKPFLTFKKDEKKYCNKDCMYNHRKELRNKRNYVAANGDILDITNTEANKLRKEATKCGICNKEFSHVLNEKELTLALDHNHQTKKFRGFLCSSCNRNLGWFENFEKQINDYLSK